MMYKRMPGAASVISNRVLVHVGWALPGERVVASVLARKVEPIIVKICANFLGCVAAVPQL